MHLRRFAALQRTNLKGHITYANTIFLDIAGYSEAEVIGQPHNMIRHPDMPRCVFKLLWDTIADGIEIFAFVKNMTRSGDHYWVLAHVTPSYDADGRTVGYHSTRRVPNPRTISNIIEPLYRDLSRIKASGTDPRDGLAKSLAHLLGVLDEKGLQYDGFVSQLSQAA